MLSALIAQYGYAAVAVGTFIEGDLVLIAGALLAKAQLLSLWGVIAAGAAGVLISDQLYFYIGRAKGRQWIATRPRWQAKAAKIFVLLHRYQWPVMFGFRFMYGVRIVTPMLIGASGISPLRFLLCNLLGTAVWATSIGWLGYGFGELMQVLVPQFQKAQWLVLAILGLGLLLWRYRTRAHQVTHARNGALGKANLQPASEKEEANAIKPV